MLVSGGDDTNIKVWDLRNPMVSRQSLTTFKSHTGLVTCVELSSSGRMLVSGADDGYMMIWDMAQFKQVRTVKIGTPTASYPICMAVQGMMSGIAVGCLNKTVKFFAVDQQGPNPSNWEVKLTHCTTIENFRPRRISFLNALAFVVFDDCIKLFDFHGTTNERPRVLDLVYKPLGHTLDFALASDKTQFYVLDQSVREENPNEPLKLSLYFHETERMNTDASVSVQQRQYRAQVTAPLDPLPKVPLAPKRIQSVEPRSVLGSAGLAMIGRGFGSNTPAEESPGPKKKQLGVYGLGPSPGRRVGSEVRQVPPVQGQGQGGPARSMVGGAGVNVGRLRKNLRMQIDRGNALNDDIERALGLAANRTNQRSEMQLARNSLQQQLSSGEGR